VSTGVSTGDDRGDGAVHPALLTVRQAAELLTVSTRTVYNLINGGKLPHYRIANAIRVAMADVEDYMADCRITCSAVVQPMPEENRQRAKKPRAGQTPVRTSHLTIGPRQLSLLRRGGVAISGPSDRSGR
jgi:excisionase family DNA binding protein